MQPIYLGNGRLLAKTANGHKMVLNGADVHVTPCLLVEGYWEPHITRLIQTLLRPGDRVMDIGAHSGYYTVLMRSIVGQSGEVVSFDANPLVAPFVVDSLFLNGFFNSSVTFYNVALGSREDTVALSVPHRHTGGSYLVDTEVKSLEMPEHFDKSQVYTVTQRTLDSMVEGDFKLVKLDVEGAEAAVFLGAERTFSNPDILIVMEWLRGTHREMPSADFLGYLTEKCGFIILEIDKNESVLNKLEVERLLEIDHTDVLLVRPTALAATEKLLTGTL